MHEVARPLGALLAAVHAFQRGAVEKPMLRQVFLQGMDDQIERLKPLLDKLASLTVLSGQHLVLQPEQVNLVIGCGTPWSPGRWPVRWTAAAAL